MKIVEQDIDQDIVRTQWRNSEKEACKHYGPDGNADEKLQNFLLKKYKIDLVLVEQEDWRNIVLPQHGERYINLGSEKTLEMLRQKFIDKLPTPSSKDDCQSKIEFQMSRFSGLSEKFNYLEGVFMFITNNKDLSVQRDYHSLDANGMYYTGSFHQFAAYVLWTVRNRFLPLRLYLIK